MHIWRVHKFVRHQRHEKVDVIRGGTTKAVRANRRPRKASTGRVEKPRSDFFGHVVDCLQGYASKGEVYWADLVIDIAGHKGGCRLGESARREVGRLEQIPNRMDPPTPPTSHPLQLHPSPGAPAVP